MRNDPLGGVDPDGHRCESDFDSFQTPEQKNWQPNTEFDRQFSTTVAKISVGVFAATDGAAAGIGKGIEAASAAGDVSLGTGLKIGGSGSGGNGHGGWRCHDRGRCPVPIPKMQ